MKNFEIPAYENAEDVDNDIEEEIKSDVTPEESQKIANRWNRFRFQGKPPKPGSIAESRLVKACHDYASYLLEIGRGCGGSLALAKGSDAKRRELHNNLAIMITGQQRSGMDETLAKEIATFAAYTTYDATIEDVIEEFNSYKN
jgi:hypothetical protein